MDITSLLEDLRDFSQKEKYQVYHLAAGTDEDHVQTLDPIPSNYAQDTFSIAKVYTMTAIGLLYDRGLVRIDEKICDILGDLVPKDLPDKRWRDVTVEMALTHRAGLPVGNLDIDCNPSTSFSDDFLGYMFNTKLIYDPGTSASYSDGAFYLLSRVVLKRTGEGMDKYLWKNLLGGIETLEAAFSLCPQGYAIGGSGVYTGAPDLVRLGLLYVNGGLYRGKRYLSREWCELSIARGFTWSKHPECDIYFKGGMHGQKIYILPKEHMSVAVTAHGANTDAIADRIKKDLNL
ncbi:MAG: beta-lactamase family protein [Clostridia bacterium]|nr:beta-lactamase family protein [Clostridia bacterium]